MINLIIPSVMGFGVGSFLGNHLSQQGITADNALEKHQTTARIIFGVIATIITLLMVIDHYNLSHNLPQNFPQITFISLDLQAFCDDLLLLFGFFTLGLLLFLELSGLSSKQRRIQLLLGLTAISFCLSAIFYWFSPIINQIKKPKIKDDIVMQTTRVTCAPASIATLARISGKQPQITEKDVAKLTKTNRLGTPTLAEISAMKKLGLNPEYHNNFSLQELLKRNQIALLHVREGGIALQFAHAVALLEIDQKNQEVILGNPLSGIQTKDFKQFKDYWFGEVIFVS